MTLSELLRWQWEGYGRYHGSRANLLIHAAAVPLFWAGTAGLVVSAARLSPLGALGAAAALVVSLAAQGRGHRLESVPPEPFTGTANAIARLFLEQWVTFPRFVASGGWLRAYRRARRNELMTP